MQKWAKLPDLMEVTWEQIWQCVRGHGSNMISSFSFPPFGSGLTGWGGEGYSGKKTFETEQNKVFRSSLSSSPPRQTRRHYFSNVARHWRLFLGCLLSAQWKSVRRFSHPQRNEWQVVGQLLVAEDQCQESHDHVWHQQGHYLTTSAEKIQRMVKEEGWGKPLNSPLACATQPQKH